jgi:hypothetical protein
MYLCALQAFNISCQKLPTAPADCTLMLYYNSTGMFEDGTTNMSELIKPPFEIPADQLPDHVAPWGTAEFNATEGPLNRTEPVYNATLRPMLFFFGGPTCHVVLTKPKIAGCQLKESVGADQAAVSMRLAASCSSSVDCRQLAPACACMHVVLQPRLFCQVEQLQALLLPVAGMWQPCPCAGACVLMQVAVDLLQQHFEVKVVCLASATKHGL